MPVSVEILPEQDTGTWSRVVKEGFLEDGVLGEMSTVKHQDHMRSQGTEVPAQALSLPTYMPWSSLSGVFKGSHRSGLDNGALGSELGWWIWPYPAHVWQLTPSFPGTPPPLAPLELGAQPLAGRPDRIVAKDTRLAWSPRPTTSYPDEWSRTCHFLSPISLS